MSVSYTIPVRGIKEGHHIYNFEIDRKFFDLFEESEIKEGDLSVTAEADKMASHMELNIKISGSVKICCDRCLEMFDHPLNCESRLLIKFGNEKDESDPEIITLPRDEPELDLSQYLYEYIHLALPIQRIHPEDEDGVSQCNPEMLKKLKEHLVEKMTGEEDPRWEELKKLMHDN